MGDSSWSLEDHNADTNRIVKVGLIRFQLETKKITRGYVCFILAKNLSAFCRCPKTWHEIEFKFGGLIEQLEKILRQTSIQTLSGVLLAAFSQFYSEALVKSRTKKYKKFAASPEKQL